MKHSFFDKASWEAQCDTVSFEAEAYGSFGRWCLLLFFQYVHGDKQDEEHKFVGHLFQIIVLFMQKLQPQLYPSVPSQQTLHANT